VTTIDRLKGELSAGALVYRIHRHSARIRSEWRDSSIALAILVARLGDSRRSRP
jgi:hypothetical protein